MADDAAPLEDPELRITGESDPLLARTLFGALLRQAREEHNETLDAVARRAKLSSPTLSRFERATRAVQLIQVSGLLDAYGITDPAVRARANDLISGLAEAWWDEYRSVIPPGLELLLRTEQDATGIFSVSTSAIGGLFQTREYASAINAGTRLPPRTEESSARGVALRMARQRLLDRDVKIVLLLDECVLRRVVGGPEVMAGQLKHLLDLAERPTITLRVIPLDRGAHPAMFVNAMILESPGQRIVYGETGLGNAYLSEPADVARVQQMFAKSLELALPPAAAIELIRELARKYGAGDR